MATAACARWRPTQWLLLLELLLSVTAAAELPHCADRHGSARPLDDLAACGLDDQVLTGLGAALYYERKCQTPACLRVYAWIDATNPSECLVDGTATSLRLHEGILKPLYAACAALASPTSAPSTAAPTAPTAPTVPSVPSVPASTPPETPAPQPTSSPSAAVPTEATMPVMVPSSVGSSDGPTASSDSTPSPTTSPTEDAQTAPRPTMLQVPVASGTGSTATASETSPPSSRDAQRTSEPAPETVAVSTGKSRSTQTPLWVGAAVAVVVLFVGFAVQCKYRQREQRKDHADGLRDASDSMNPGYDAATDEDLTTAYTTSTDGTGGSDGGGVLLVSSPWRNEMESRLRGDPTLELWRVSAGTITTKRLVGRGSHAFVHLVAVSDGTLLASKRLAIDQVTPNQFAQLVGEAHIVSTLQHRSIVTFAGVAWTSPLDFQVLFEYMEGGDLRTYLDKNKPSVGSATSSLSWSPVKLQMALAIAEGLTYAHSFNPPLVHRDLKSRNILLTRDLEAKISDFGVSRFLSDNDTMTTGMGTTRWLAPEVISGGGTYNELCDIYSFGVVLTELDTHDVPFAKEMMDESGHKTRSELWLLQQVARGNVLPSLSTSCPEGIRALATRCLSFHAAERPNALWISYALRKMHREL